MQNIFEYIPGNFLISVHIKILLVVHTSVMAIISMDHTIICLGKTLEPNNLLSSPNIKKVI